MVHRGWNTDRVLVPGRARPIPLRRHKKVFPMDVAKANAFWARLDDHAVATYGWDQIDLRDLQAPTFAEHPWGAFYVHYTPDYYHRFLAELLKLSLSSRLDLDTLEQIARIEAAAAEPGAPPARGGARPPTGCSGAGSRRARTACASSSRSG